MFDNITATGLKARRRGTSLLVSILLHGLIVLVAIFTYKQARKMAAEEAVAVTFRPVPSTAPPPPPPPPKAHKRKTPRTKPKTPQPKVPVRAIIQPKEPPKVEEKPPEQKVEEPEEEEEDEEGAVEGGVEGGVAGGVIGGVLGGVLGGTGGGPVKPPARMEFNETMTPPKVLSGPNPEYTEKALEREVEGLMVVKCVVTVEGAVHDCRVVQTLPFMDRAVITALEHRRYSPALLQGKPVEVNYTFKIRLTLPR